MWKIGQSSLHDETVFWWVLYWFKCLSSWLGTPGGQSCINAPMKRLIVLMPFDSSWISRTGFFCLKKKVIVKSRSSLVWNNLTISDELAIETLSFIFSQILINYWLSMICTWPLKMEFLYRSLIETWAWCIVTILEKITSINELAHCGFSKQFTILPSNNNISRYYCTFMDQLKNAS